MERVEVNYIQRGFEEGFYSVQFLNPEILEVEAMHDYLQGLKMGKSVRETVKNFEDFLVKTDRPNYILYTGYKAAAENFPATDEYLKADDKNLFNKGKDLVRHLEILKNNYPINYNSAFEEGIFKSQLLNLSKMDKTKWDFYLKEYLRGQAEFSKFSSPDQFVFNQDRGNYIIIAGCKAERDGMYYTDMYLKSDDEHKDNFRQGVNLIKHLKELSAAYFPTEQITNQK